MLNIGKPHFIHFSISGRTILDLSVVVNEMPVAGVATTIIFIGFELAVFLGLKKNVKLVKALTSRSCALELVVRATH